MSARPIAISRPRPSASRESKLAKPAPAHPRLPRPRASARSLTVRASRCERVCGRWFIARCTGRRARVARARRAVGPAAWIARAFARRAGVEGVRADAWLGVTSAAGPDAGAYEVRMRTGARLLAMRARQRCVHEAQRMAARGRDARTCRGSAVRVGAYEGQLRDTIREVKFKRFSTLGVDLGRELGRTLAAVIRESHAPAPIVLVPVAMPIVRRLRRGVDHSKAIAVGASREMRDLGVDARVAHLLARRHRPSQLEGRPARGSATPPDRS